MWKHSSYELTKVRRTFTRTTIEENGQIYSISFNKAVQDQDQQENSAIQISWR